jgi:hypothetical protein
MDLITQLATTHPIIVTILTFIGLFRAVFKPIFTVLRSYVDATPNPADNKILDNVEGSSVFKAIAFVLDYTMSIKLKGQP